MLDTDIFVDVPTQVEEFPCIPFVLRLFFPPQWLLNSVK